MPQLAGRKNEMSGALWLIELGVLFLTGSFWLKILVLIGLTAYVQSRDLRTTCIGNRGRRQRTSGSMLQ